jgi:hypothetical protein
MTMCRNKVGFCNYHDELNRDNFLFANINVGWRQSRELVKLLLHNLESLNYQFLYHNGHN